MSGKKIYETGAKGAASALAVRTKITKQMKKSLVYAALGMFCASVLFAADGDAKADVKAAAKKVADKGNYSWTQSSKSEGGQGGGRFGGGNTEGQLAEGITYLKSTFGERTMHTAAKGEKVIVKGEDAWEVPDTEGQGPGRFAAMRMRNFKAPATEAGELADKATELKSADGVISGPLSEEGVKALMTFGRGRGGNNAPPAPKNASGSVKFWVKNGELSKYEYNVKGTITGRDDNEMTINRTTTVELKDVGTTKLALPDEAKKKL
jgi:hypothetical protein